MSISIGPALHPAHAICELRNRRRDSILTELARHAHVLGAAHEPDLLHATLCLRERLGSTAAVRGVAFPNARSLLVLRPLMLVGRSRRGVDWDAPDGEPVRLVVLVLSPADTALSRHLGAIAHALAVLRPARVRQRLLEAEVPPEIAGLLHGAWS